MDLPKESPHVLVLTELDRAAAFLSVLVDLQVKVVAGKVSPVSSVMLSKDKMASMFCVKVRERAGAGIQVSTDQHTTLGLEAADLIVELGDDLVVTRSLCHFFNRLGYSFLLCS